MDEAMFERAVGVLVLSDRASTAFLQMKLRVPYKLAAQLMERAANEGIVSEPNAVGKRDVLARIPKCNSHQKET